MTKQKPQIMILCEDKSHLHFIKGYCEEAGWSPRSFISQVYCPEGTQSAEQFVRDEFSRTLRTLRSRHGQGRNVILIVMIDGDKYEVSERIARLQQEEKRKAGEPVAFFVPKRNIQSWMAFLDGKLENEDVDYKNVYGKGTPNGDFGRRLRKRCDGGETASFPASLKDACEAWRELPGV